MVASLKTPAQKLKLFSQQHPEPDCVSTNKLEYHYMRRQRNTYRTHTHTHTSHSFTPKHTTIRYTSLMRRMCICVGPSTICGFQTLCTVYIIYEYEYIV